MSTPPHENRSSSEAAVRPGPTVGSDDSPGLKASEAVPQPEPSKHPENYPPQAVTDQGKDELNGLRTENEGYKSQAMRQESCNRIQESADRQREAAQRLEEAASSLENQLASERADNAQRIKAYHYHLKEFNRFRKKMKDDTDAALFSKKQLEATISKLKNEILKEREEVAKREQATAAASTEKTRGQQDTAPVPVKPTSTQATEIQNLETTCQALRHAAATERALHETTVAGLQELHTSLKSKLDAATVEVKGLRDERESLKHEVTEQRRALYSLREDVKAAEEQAKRQETSAAVDGRPALFTQCTELQRSLETERAEKARLAMNIGLSEFEVNRLKDEIKTLTSGLDAAKRSAEETQRKAQADREELARLRQIAAQAESVRATTAELKGEICRLEEHCARMRGQMSADKNETEQLKHEGQEKLVLLEQLLQVEIARLHGQVATEKAAADELKEVHHTEADRLRSSLTDLKQQLATQVMTDKRTMDELKLASGVESERLRAEVALLRSQVASELREKEEMTERHVAEVEGIKEHFQKEVCELSTQIEAEKRGKCDIKQLHVEEVRRINERFRKDLDRLQTDVDAASLARTEVKIAHADEVQRMDDRAREEIRRLQEELKVVTPAREKLQKLHDAAVQDLSQAKSSLEAERREKDNWVKKYDHVQLEVARLMKQPVELRRQVSEVKEKDLERTKTQPEEGLTAHRLQVEFNDLQRELSELRHLTEGYTSEWSRLNGKYDDKVNECSRLEVDVRGLRVKLFRAEKSHSDLMRELDESKSRLTGVQADLLVEREEKRLVRQSYYARIKDVTRLRKDVCELQDLMTSALRRSHTEQPNAFGSSDRAILRRGRYDTGTPVSSVGGLKTSASLFP